MAAPTFISSATAAYTSTVAPRTLSVTTTSGDLVIVYAGLETPGEDVNAPSGNSISFSLQAAEGHGGAHSPVYIWSGTDSSGGTNWTLSDSHTNPPGGYVWGFTYAVFRNHNGVGANNSAGVIGSTNNHPYVTLTTTSDNSAIVVAITDWNATNGATRTWHTVNGVTPTSGNGYELSYGTSSQFTAYGAYWPDAGAAGAKTVGLSNLDNHNYAIVALEIKGVAGGGGLIPLPWMRF